MVLLPFPFISSNNTPTLVDYNPELGFVKDLDKNHGTLINKDKKKDDTDLDSNGKDGPSCEFNQFGHCLNGGVCERYSTLIDDKSYYYKCTCPKNYYGIYCENINPCLIIFDTCKSNQVCVPGLNAEFACLDCVEGNNQSAPDDEILKNRILVYQNLTRTRGRGGIGHEHEILRRLRTLRNIPETFSTRCLPNFKPPTRPCETNFCGVNSFCVDQFVQNGNDPKLQPTCICKNYFSGKFCEIQPACQTNFKHFSDTSKVSKCLDIYDDKFLNICENGYFGEFCENLRYDDHSSSHVITSPLTPTIDFTVKSGSPTNDNDTISASRTFSEETKLIDQLIVLVISATLTILCVTFSLIFCCYKFFCNSSPYAKIRRRVRRFLGLKLTGYDPVSTQQDL